MVFLKKIQAAIDSKTLLVLIGYSVLIRVVLFFGYYAITIFPDSHDYIFLAKQISSFDLSTYSGKRTPGYPILLSILQNNLIALIFLQLLLGILSTLLLFDISKKLSKSKSIGFWVAIIYTSFMHVVLYDFAVLTEALTVFLVLASVWLIVKFQLFESNKNKLYYIFLSIVLAWLYLTRPLYIYIPVGFAIFYSVKSIKSGKSGFKNAFFKSSLVLLIPLLSYFLWNNHNKQTIGYFTNTQYFGINLAQTATPFFEKAPKQHALIRDIIVKHRDSILKIKPTLLPMSVWLAHEELLEKTQLSEIELSNQLGEISKNLFKAHPTLYLKQVATSWLLFWGNQDSLKWEYSKIKQKVFKTLATPFWLHFQRYILVLFNLLFLLFSVIKLFKFFKDYKSHFDYNLFIVCIVLSGSLAQALVAYGSNSRFCFPFFPLIVYFVIYNIYAYKGVITAKK